MVDAEQVASLVIQNGKDIAAMSEKVDSAHKRLNENDNIIRGIHKLATNMETLTLQVKSLAEKMDSNIERIESGLSLQSDRIGVLEKEPAAKWKDLVKQVTALVVVAVVTAIIARLM